MQQIGHFINGKITASNNGRLQDVYNPSTGAVSKQVQLADRQLVAQTITNSQTAFASWRDVAPIKRARIMFKYRELLEKHGQEICALIGSEHGKVAHDAAGELQRGIENVEFACAAPELLKSEYCKNASSQIDSWSDYQPLGVVAGITPFNFPAMVPLWMFPLAIVCGNSFILKPSERDPSVTLFLAQLLSEAGLPDGVFNVLNGDQEVVQALLEDQRVKALSFVGSTAIAAQIYAKAGTHGKRCQALGGAKNHAVVMPDADMDNVVNSLLGAAFGSSGERCMALSVVVAIGDAIADQLISQLSAAMAKIKVGSFSDSSNDFGPVITKAHQQKVIDYINSAEQDGAKIVVDGRNITVPGYENGFYVGATLIDNVTASMRSYKEEIFGPVLQVIRVANLEQAMELINAHEYGNGTCIYTRDGETARHFSDKILVGMVGINIPLPVPMAFHSFGGWKNSIFGDLAAYGPDGVRFYTKRKTITQRWPTRSIIENATFSMPSTRE